MTHLFSNEVWLLFGVITILWLLTRFERNWKPPKTKPPVEAEFQYFEAVDSLFASRAEQTFYQILARALPPSYTLLTKVRLEDVIRVKKTIKDNQLRWRLRGRVKSRHIDFVIMDRHGIPRIAIELDGPHHRQNSAKNADDLKDGLFKAANIAFFRVRTGENFNNRANELVELLESS